MHLSCHDPDRGSAHNCWRGCGMVFHQIPQAQIKTQTQDTSLGMGGIWLPLPRPPLFFINDAQDFYEQDGNLWRFHARRIGSGIVETEKKEKKKLEGGCTYSIMYLGLVGTSLSWTSISGCFGWRSKAVTLDKVFRHQTARPDERLNIKRSTNIIYGRLYVEV